MEKTRLYYECEKIINNAIHLAKCKLEDKITREIWDGLDSKKLAEESMVKIQEMLELWAYIPCCHTSGMHNPTHFDERQYICESQKSEAFERFCKDLGINPVTRSKPDCCWCRDYPHYRKGEGLALFTTEET